MSEREIKGRTAFLAGGRPSFIPADNFFGVENKKGEAPRAEALALIFSSYL